MLLSAEVSLGDLVVFVKRENLVPFFRVCKLDKDLQFNLLLDVTAVDWLDSRPERFEVVYLLRSLVTLHELRVKTSITETAAKVESVTILWASANLLEREVWDMYGIKFEGHPDLRRILMYDEFEGFPLRKDYPVQGKQPRVGLRSPEVSNTARNMRREALVKINKPKRDSASPVQEAH